MKKIKYLVLTALFCAFGVEAMAADETWANRTFRYTYNDGGATIIGFVNDYPAADMATLTIPEAVTKKDDKTAVNVIAIAADAFKDNKNIKKVIFSSDKLVNIYKAFSGCTALATVDFSAATGVKTIDEKAFEKAPITKLDLSKTKVTAVYNLLGTTLDPADPKKDVKNTSLTEVSLPKTWTSIAEAAFANCTSLATISFGKADAAQTINTKAFAYCPITALDFTDTKVSEIPAQLLYVTGTARDAKNESLTSVTLTKEFTASATGFNSSFANCTALAEVKNLEKTAIVQLNNNEFDGDKALATINVSKIINFGAYAFQNCEALKSVTFAASKPASGPDPAVDVRITLGNYAFAGTGLTKVTFPKGTNATTQGIADIPEGCFLNCAALAEVKWDADEVSLSTIGKKAFAGTAITAIDIPVKATLGKTAGDIAEKAFAICEKLVTFKWNPTGGDAAAFNADAFYLCNDYVTIYTDVAVSPVPAHAQVKAYNAAPGTEFAKLKLTAYKNGLSKYYYKMKATEDIAIAKGAAKVYDAWVDPSDEGVLNMQAYKPVAGNYQIATNDVCLIVSDTEEVEYTTGTFASSSISQTLVGPSLFTVNPDAAGLALQMKDAATTRVALLLDAPAADYALYVWMNGASGTGFQKLGSGNTVPANTLFAYAKEPAAGGRLIVKWYDEDGNLEGETTAIQSVEAQAAEAEGESFNLSGQKVAAGYKGIVIKNGKKMIVK